MPPHQFRSTLFEFELTRDARAALSAAIEVGAPERLVAQIADAVRVVPSASCLDVVRVVCLAHAAELPWDDPVDLVLVFNALADFAEAARGAPARRLGSAERGRSRRRRSGQ
jgi:hypothetical protein